METAISTNGSIIEESQLFNQSAWPETDPSKRTAGARIANAWRRNLAEQCAVSPYLPGDEWWHTHLGTGNALHEVVLDYLNHSAIQFNSKRLFRACPNIRSKIENAIANDSCIQVILPAFCVISAWHKRHDVTSLTFAEEVSIRHLAHVARLLQDHCGVKLKIIIISDATFYAGIFHDPIDAARQYVADLDELTTDPAIRDFVTVADMSQIISQRACEYRHCFEYHCRRFSAEPAEGLSSEEARRLAASVGSTVNIDDFQLSYPERRALFCGGVFPTESIEKAIMARMNRAYVMYRSMKEALADISWECIDHGGALRGTIHHKTAAVVGVRIYPGYKKYCQILPYHGVAVVRREKKKWIMTIEFEINQTDAVTRVEKDNGATDFYLAEKYLHA